MRSLTVKYANGINLPVPKIINVNINDKFNNVLKWAADYRMYEYIHRMGQKNRTIFKSVRLLYMMRQESDLYIKMLSSLSGVKLIFGMSPYLNILGMSLEKPYCAENTI